MKTGAWDYLIVTASNECQASAYADELALRKGLGLIPGVREVLAVADPGGKRVGSGGSTVWCLLNSRRIRPRPGHDHLRPPCPGLSGSARDGGGQGPGRCEHGRRAPDI